MNLWLAVFLTGNSNIMDDDWILMNKRVHKVLQSRLEEARRMFKNLSKIIRTTVLIYKFCYSVLRGEIE